MPKYHGVRKKGRTWSYRIGANYEKAGFETAEAAYRARNEHKERISQGEADINNITVYELIHRYLTDYEIPNNRQSTAIKTEGICRNHIIPYLGNKKIQQLKPYDIEIFKNKIVANKTPAVAHNTMRTLRKIMNKAIEWEIIEKSPLKTKIPSAPKSTHPVLMPEQLFYLVDNLKGRDKYIVALAGFAGLRRGEIGGLRWEDIDFNNNFIFLKRQYTEGLIEELKTESSGTPIPIWNRLTELLKEWKLQSGSHTWVFKGKGDRPFAIHSWTGDEWRRIRKEFNLPERLRFHDLRHTFASILLAHNAQPGDVQKLMRHTSVRTTMDIYRHVLPGQLERNFEVFNELYWEKVGKEN